MPSSTSSSTDDPVERARRVLEAGGVIGLPTETVYGLAADATSSSAVRKIFSIKGRPADHPLILHVADLAAAQTLSSRWTDTARALAEAFWPGPLTLVVVRSAEVLDEVTGGRTTVAIRIPRHALALRVLQEFGRPVAAPSANRFGRVSPTTADHVRADLGADVDFVLDGGPCEVGLESTIVDCSVDPPQILRPGSISAEQISEVVGGVASASGPSRAPGMLESHYAPDCLVVPVDVGDASPNDVDRVLDGRSEPARFAHDLYALLRECDRLRLRRVAVLLPADSGIGRAVRDRVFKAAARRSH
ncbi:MAG: threonylcarbamoyl-AMP synthase [Acidimicrobiales bacterium mtb01]|nr:threonylcarbamoyl-AMP synthase [Actinomycetota bacterium]TEX45251.1 MAG: threonylcarbamoyl-AMP synthase [Acidimicrobiales bacterium mtb01]